jgi:hypothetical protein
MGNRKCFLEQFIWFYLFDLYQGRRGWPGNYIIRLLLDGEVLVPHVALDNSVVDSGELSHVLCEKLHDYY